MPNAARDLDFHLTCRLQKTPLERRCNIGEHTFRQVVALDCNLFCKCPITTGFQVRRWPYGKGCEPLMQGSEAVTSGTPIGRTAFGVHGLLRNAPHPPHATVRGIRRCTRKWKHRDANAAPAPSLQQLQTPRSPPKSSYSRHRRRRLHVF